MATDADGGVVAGKSGGTVSTVVSVLMVKLMVSICPRGGGGGTVEVVQM